MEEGRIHDQHEFRRVASITTRGRSRWLTEETKCNLLKCGRQEELLWTTVNQDGRETNISTVWKTEGAIASTRPALTTDPTLFLSITSPFCVYFIAFIAAWNYLVYLLSSYS